MWKYKKPAGSLFWVWLEDEEGHEMKMHVSWEPAFLEELKSSNNAEEVFAAKINELANLEGTPFDFNDSHREESSPIV